MLPDWSAVPSGVLELISKRLLSWDNYVRFRSVCNSWRSAAPARPHVPLILVENSRSMVPPLLISNFPNTELYTLPQTPEWMSNHYICGSSRGWICWKSWKSDSVSLHNPFTGVHIRLPVLPNHARPKKVVVSSDPAIQPHHCIVMARCHNQLMLHCRPGDATWKIAHCSYSAMDTIEDIIFYRGKSYILTIFNHMFGFDFGADDPGFVEILPAVPLFYGRSTLVSSSMEKFLVASSGELLMAIVTGTYNNEVSVCDVYRVDFGGGQLRFFKLENLGGRSLFLSRCSASLSLDPSSDPWCKANCIYYAGVYPSVTVFNMEDGSISSIKYAGWDFKIWFTPSLS